MNRHHPILALQLVSGRRIASVEEELREDIQDLNRRLSRIERLAEGAA
jgi:uncharacterized protein YoaH (UPF0181 family)